MEFRETEERISLHGLGFIQIKLGGKQRMHVWHPALPRRSCFIHSAIHDHRFGFTSQVLVGAVRNTVFRVVPSQWGEEPTHISYLHEGPRAAHGGRPWIVDDRVAVTEEFHEDHAAGQSYSMMPFVFHASNALDAGCAATLLTKTFEGKRGAHSLCAVGIKPDVAFDRKQWPDTELWAVVREVLGGELIDRCGACGRCLIVGQPTGMYDDIGECCEECAPTWAEVVENLALSDDAEQRARGEALRAEIAAGTRDGNAKAVS